MAERKQQSSGGWLEIRKKLCQVTDRDLLALVGELYSFSAKNRSFLDSRFLRDAKTLDKYKAVIRKNLCPEEYGWEDLRSYFNIKGAKEAISEYKKATGDEWGVLELMVYYTEVACAFASKSGDLFDAYYNSVISVYKNALTFLLKQETNERLPYMERLKKLPEITDNIGWGFPDSLNGWYLALLHEEKMEVNKE